MVFLGYPLGKHRPIRISRTHNVTLPDVRGVSRRFVHQVAEGIDPTVFCSLCTFSGTLSEVWSPQCHLRWNEKVKPKLIHFFYDQRIMKKLRLATVWTMYRLLGACDTMMTSWNGNIFRVAGHLCGEFTGHRWIPRTKASGAALWCFLSAAE